MEAHIIVVIPVILQLLLLILFMIECEPLTPNYKNFFMKKITVAVVVVINSSEHSHEKHNCGPTHLFQLLLLLLLLYVILM